MHLATTALTEFWDENDEQLFLGPWCRPRAKKSQWQKFRGTVLPSPWDEPGLDRKMVARSEHLQEELLEFLGPALGEILGVRRGSRYWRLLLGPWVMAYATTLTDAWLHLDAALRAHPTLKTTVLDPLDFALARDTQDYNSQLLKDSFHLQLHSEIFAALGRTFPARRLSGPPEPDPRPAPAPPSGPKAAAKALLEAAARGRRRLPSSGAYFSDMYLGRKDCWKLVKASRGALFPIGEKLPQKLPLDQKLSAQRPRLAELPAADELGRIAARLLPGHLPALFLEGFPAWRRHVLSRWPKPPRRVMTSVGWMANEYVKLLAAESVEAGGSFVICQHGGAYGIMEPMHSERHERKVADQYWTWGWSDGAKNLRPMPNPRLWRPRPAKPETGRELALICCSLPRYPYFFYFANMPVSHRFEEYLAERERFIAALPETARRALNVHLYPLDLGWDDRGRLAERFPGLRFEASPWSRRLSSIGLLIVDHPQTSLFEGLALDVPTLAFWNPVLWRNRPEAQEALDDLRGAGILQDGPQAAAAKAAAIASDPRSWWDEAGVRQARERFRRRFALGNPEWPRLWAAAAEEK